MYIRWKDKPRRPDWKPNGKGWNERTKPVMLYSAYLAECKRVDGKPRQTATYLASIRDCEIDEIAPRIRFWESILPKLQDVPPAKIPPLEAAIARRVPIPTEEERQRCCDEMQKEREDMRTSFFNQREKQEMKLEDIEYQIWPNLITAIREERAREKQQGSAHKNDTH